MKAIVISREGPPEVLEPRDFPSPEPGPGEIRLRVRAAGINFADLMMRTGRYVGAPPVPFVPGYEVAGEVDKAGPGVTELKPGRRSLTAMASGGYAEFVLADAAGVAPIPDGKSFEEAAALPVNYLTAYHALYVLGNLRPKSRVLVHGAGGGVGSAAIQLAKLRGALVIGTASAGKHAFAKGQGADHMIDCRTEDFAARVREITGGRGVHLALDPVGGKSFKASYACLTETGLLVAYGASAMAGKGMNNAMRALATFLASGFFSPLRLMMDNRGVVGLHLGRLRAEPELLAGEMAALVALWAEGKIRPHVDAAIPAERAAEAHRRLQDRKNLGKIVLTF